MLLLMLETLSIFKDKNANDMRKLLFFIEKNRFKKKLQNQEKCRYCVMFVLETLSTSRLKV